MVEDDAFRKLLLRRVKLIVTRVMPFVVYSMSESNLYSHCASPDCVTNSINPGHDDDIGLSLVES